MNVAPPRAPRAPRLRRAGLVALGALALAIVVAASLSLLAPFGVVWSSPDPPGVRVHAVGWRAGALVWEVRALDTPLAPPVRLHATRARSAAAPFCPPAWTIAGNSFRAIAPFWLLVLAVGVPSAVLARYEFRDARRRRRGCCGACGYDLRGLPARAGVDRCPECGQPRPTRRTGADQRARA